MNLRAKNTVFFFVLIIVLGIAGCRASDCGCPQTNLMERPKIEEAKLG